jgi:hypothetical protein
MVGFRMWQVVYPEARDKNQKHFKPRYSIRLHLKLDQILWLRFKFLQQVALIKGTECVSGIT